MLYEDYIRNNKTAFLEKTKVISKMLGISPDWLMFVMKKESNINPQAQNLAFPHKEGYATGLIQFTPDTAKSLGTSVKELYQMNNLKQLDYVYKYLFPYRNKMRNVADVYFSVFFPAAIAKPNNYVLETKKIAASRIARSNPVFDLNKDLKITVGEFKRAILQMLPMSSKKKIQALRLFDVFVITPILFYAASRKNVSSWLRYSLYGIGAGTAIYNGANYLKNR